MLTLREHARRLRRDATPWEVKLWSRLRRLKSQGLHFRRQVATGGYIEDFACYSHRLIVELDGGQHATDARTESDARRDRWLRDEGFLVLRFWNNEVGEDVDAVADAIVRMAEERRPRSLRSRVPPPHEGEG